MDQILKCSLDWLAFTYKSSDVFDEFEFEHFMEAFPEIKDQSELITVKIDGKNTYCCYDHVLAFNDSISIQYRSKRMKNDQASTNMGVNVVVPSHALAWFFGIFDIPVDRVDKLLKLLQDRGCTFSRIDLAYDDYSKMFTPHDYNRFYATDSIVSTCKNFRFFSSKQTYGATFYIGNRASGRLLRIYDKEYQSNGRINAVRYEFELGKKYNPTIVQKLIETNEFPNFLDLLHGFIRSVRYRDMNHMETLKNNLPLLPKWKEFEDRMNEILLSRVDYEFRKVSATMYLDPEDIEISTSRFERNVLFPGIKDLADLYGIGYVIEKINSSKNSGSFRKRKLVKDVIDYAASLKIPIQTDRYSHESMDSTISFHCACL